MVSNPRLLLLPSVLCLLLASCGSSGGSSSFVGAPGSVGFSVQDAGVDSFSKVSIRLSSLKLLDSTGAATANLLAAPRSFDFLGLSLKQALLALVPSVPAGSYTDLELVIDQVSVLDLAGAPVVVTLSTVLGSADLTAFGGGPLVFNGSFVPCAIDIDLDRSFSEDSLNPGQFFFDLAFLADASQAPALDEFRATVMAIDAPSGRFTGRLIDDAVSGSGFGTLDIVVAAGDFLAHGDGRIFSTASAFLAELDAGEVVQVSGLLRADGVFDANRVVEEDDGPSGRNRIEIEGEVRSLDAVAGTFDLLVKEIEKGASVAAPVLAGLADPHLITISYDASTLVFADDAGASGSGLVDATLAVGLEVDVRFAVFAAPGPFLATSIEVGDGREGADDGIEYEGISADIAGLPVSFTLTFDAQEPALLAGLVSAAVEIQLATAPRIFLDAGPKPDLLATDLLANQRMKVYGLLSGAPGSALLAPTKIKVKPGELEGNLTSVSLGAGTITVEITKIKRSFGGAVNPSGTVVIAVAPNAHIRTNAGNHALVDLAALLGGSATALKLKGIADSGGALTAWEIDQD